MSATLECSVEQRMVALGRGNVVRERRREFKAELKAGERLIEDVVREPEWWLFSVPVFELLSWAPGIGSTRVNTYLRRARVWPLREVGRLTLGQRQRLVEEIGRGM